jgi:hypothetical protein
MRALFGLVLMPAFYLSLLYMGGDRVADRYWYFKIFNDPELDVRMGLAFPLLVQALHFLVPSDYGVMLLLGVCIYSLALRSISEFSDSRDLNIYLIMPFLFFGYASIFSFVQFRAAIVVWGALILLLSDLKVGYKVVGVLILASVHKLLIGALIIYSGLVLFLRSSLAVRLLIALAVFMLLIFMQPILLLLGVDEYWFKYFRDENKTNPLTSPFYWLTLGAILLNNGFKSISGSLIDFIYVQVSAFALLVSVLTGLSIFIKMTMPFILLNMMSAIYILAGMLRWEMRGRRALLAIGMWALLAWFSIVRYT